jgi:hypothetical protein
LSWSFLLLETLKPHPFYEDFLSKFASMESSSSLVTPTPKEKTLTLWPGTYRSPVTDALWHVRSSFVRRVRNVSPPLNGPAAAQSRLLQHRTPEQSRTSVMYGFSSDAVLREQYRDPWNSIRIGMLLEDLDSLAGSIALKVNSNLVSELVTPELFQSWAFEKL